MASMHPDPDSAVEPANYSACTLFAVVVYFCAIIMRDEMTLVQSSVPSLPFQNNES